MKIVVLGATGATGQWVTDLLLNAGHDVTAFARNPADITVTNDRLKVVQGDASKVEDLERALNGQNAVVSALGPRGRKKPTVLSVTARNLSAAMKKLSLRRLVWLSLAGAGDSAEQARRSSFVFGRIIMPLLLTDVFADATLAEGVLRDSGLDWVMVRAVGLSNKAARGDVKVITDVSEQLPRTSIPRADVARFMVGQLTNDTYLRKTPVIC